MRPISSARSSRSAGTSRRPRCTSAGPSSRMATVVISTRSAAPIADRMVEVIVSVSNRAARSSTNYSTRPTASRAPSAATSPTST